MRKYLQICYLIFSILFFFHFECPNGFKSETHSIYVNVVFFGCFFFSFSECMENMCFKIENIMYYNVRGLMERNQLYKS